MAEQKKPEEKLYVGSLRRPYEEFPTGQTKNLRQYIRILKWWINFAKSRMRVSRKSGSVGGRSRKGSVYPTLNAFSGYKGGLSAQHKRQFYWATLYNMWKRFLLKPFMRRVLPFPGYFKRFILLQGIDFCGNINRTTDTIHVTDFVNQNDRRRDKRFRKWRRTETGFLQNGGKENWALCFLPYSVLLLLMR